MFLQILEYNLNEKLITKWLIIEWGLIDKILRKEWHYVPQSITNQNWELIAEWNRNEWGMIEKVRSPTACNLKIKLSITQSLLNHKVSVRNLTHEWIVSEDFPLWFSIRLRFSQSHTHQVARSGICLGPDWQFHNHEWGILNQIEDFPPSHPELTRDGAGIKQLLMDELFNYVSNLFIIFDVFFSYQIKALII